MLDLAQALRATGDNQEAAALCEELLGRSELPISVRVAGLTELSQAEFRAGHVDAAAARIDEAVTLTEAEPPGLAALVLVDQAHLRLLRSGPRGAFPLATRARAVAAQAGDQIRLLAEAAWGPCAGRMSPNAATSCLIAIGLPLGRLEYLVEVPLQELGIRAVGSPSRQRDDLPGRS